MEINARNDLKMDCFVSFIRNCINTNQPKLEIPIFVKIMVLVNKKIKEQEKSKNINFDVMTNK